MPFPWRISVSGFDGKEPLNTVEPKSTVQQKPTVQAKSTVQPVYTFRMPKYILLSMNLPFSPSYNSVSRLFQVLLPVDVTEKILKVLYREDVVALICFAVSCKQVGRVIFGLAEAFSDPLSLNVDLEDQIRSGPYFLMLPQWNGFRDHLRLMVILWNGASMPRHRSFCYCCHRFRPISRQLWDYQKTDQDKNDEDLAVSEHSARESYYQGPRDHRHEGENRDWFLCCPTCRRNLFLPVLTERRYIEGIAEIEQIRPMSSPSQRLPTRMDPLLLRRIGGVRNQHRPGERYLPGCDTLLSPVRPVMPPPGRTPCPRVGTFGVLSDGLASPVSENLVDDALLQLAEDEYLAKGALPDEVQERASDLASRPTEHSEDILLPPTQKADDQALTRSEQCELASMRTLFSSPSQSDDGALIF